MTLVLHGTAAVNLPYILKHGFDTDSTTRNWSCSGDETYFWHPRRLREANDFESYNESMCEAFRRALDSAECALAFNHTDCRRVILAVEVPEKDLSDDYSCQGMGGAVCTSKTVPASAIKSIYIDSEDLRPMLGYILANMDGHKLANELNMTPVEQVIASFFKGQECQEIYEYLLELANEMELVKGKPVYHSF